MAILRGPVFLIRLTFPSIEADPRFYDNSALLYQGELNYTASRKRDNTVGRLGLTQEIGSACEEGTILLPGLQ